MALIGPNNALAWAHFRLRGGWQRTFTVSGGALALLAILILASVYANPKNATQTLMGWTTGILTIQAACLILFIPGRINAIIRQDIAAKMLESHRLMPVAPADAVAGYLIGTAMQPLIFSGGLYAMGAVTGGFAGVDLLRWSFANAVLLAFSLFLWVLSSYTSFSLKVGSALVFFPMLLPWMSAGNVLVVLPAMTVLLSPIIGQSVFELRTVSVTLPATYALSFAAQAAFFIIFFIAATRKYRSAGAIGIDTVLGIAVVLAWVAITCAGMREWEDLRPRTWPIREASPEVKIVASIATGMLLAIACVAANALERVRWRRHEALRDPAAMRRPTNVIIAIAIVTAALLFIPAACRDSTATTVRALSVTAAVIVIFLISLYLLFSAIYRVRPRAAVLVILWLLVTCFLPMLIDMARYEFADGLEETESMSVLSACSPLGALIVAWCRPLVPIAPGIAVQALLGCIPAMLWMMSRRKPIEANLVPATAAL